MWLQYVVSAVLIHPHWQFCTAALELWVDMEIDVIFWERRARILVSFVVVWLGEVGLERGGRGVREELCIIIMRGIFNINYLIAAT